MPSKQKTQKRNRKNGGTDESEVVKRDNGGIPLLGDVSAKFSTGLTNLTNFISGPAKEETFTEDLASLDKAGKLGSTASSIDSNLTTELGKNADGVVADANATIPGVNAVGKDAAAGGRRRKRRSSTKKQSKKATRKNKSSKRR